MTSAECESHTRDSINSLQPPDQGQVHGRLIETFDTHMVIQSAIHEKKNCDKHFDNACMQT